MDEICESIDSLPYSHKFTWWPLTQVTFDLFNLQEDCPACSQIPQTLSFSEDAKLNDILDYLKESAS